MKLSELILDLMLLQGKVRENQGCDADPEVYVVQPNNARNIELVDLADFCHNIDGIPRVCRLEEWDPPSPCEDPNRFQGVYLT